MQPVAAELGVGGAGDTVAGAGVWIAVIALVAVIMVGASVRVVKGHERAVISRFGRVVRVRGPGPQVVVPGIERLATVSLHPHGLPLVVPAVTYDGIPVHLVGTATIRVVDAALTDDAEPDATSATGEVIDAALAKEVALTDVVDLLPGLEGIEARVARAATAITEPWGVEVVDLGVTDIETRLTNGLVRALHDRSEADER